VRYGPAWCAHALVLDELAGSEDCNKCVNVVGLQHRAILTAI
jgi:hypothetical protein